MTDVAGRTAFVTGGAAGIGLGIARALLDRGARVAIADIRADALDRAVAGLAAGERLLPVLLDVTDRAAYAAAVDATEAALGPIGILCNNAGVGVTGPIKDAAFDDWDWLQSVLLGGVVNGVMTVLPRMRARGRGGHIVNTASMAGLFRAGDAGIYITLKYAVVGMAEALRAELIDEGIGVSAFVPGPTRTDIYWSHQLRPPGFATGYAAIDAMREQAGAQAWQADADDDFLKDPVTVGRRVVEGILADDLFIFGHSAFRQAIERRHAALLRAIPDVPLSDVTLQQARRLNENPIYDLQRVVPPIAGEIPVPRPTAACAPDAPRLHPIDAARLTPRYWLLFGLVMIQLVFEIFDFVIVGYLVSAIAPVWHLTFGKITAILTAAGIGAIFGSLAFGALADRIGRRHTILISATIYTLAAGSIAFLPTGDWRGFCLLRLIVGFGYAGCVTAQFTLVTEWTPTRLRTLLTSSLSMPASLGVMLAAGVFAAFFPSLGWRGIAALGYLPLAVAVLIWLTTPESARWLAARGRHGEAGRSFTRLFATGAGTLPPEVVHPVPTPRGSFRTLVADRRRFWLVVIPNISLATALSGVLLWAPMLLSVALAIPPAQAARQTIVITLAGLGGRLLFAYLPHRIGRVPAGQIIGYGGTLALLAVALFHDAALGGVSVLLIALVAGQIFYEGGFANVLTYAAEIYPTRLASLAMGTGQAAGGVGKMAGPLLLGLFAGTGTAATAVATRAAITPGFLALAVCCLAGALTYTFAGIETNRRDLPA